MGALRVSARSGCLPAHSLSARHISTLDVLPRATVLRQTVPRPYSPTLSSCARRHLSLGSIFSRPKPVTTPAPLVVAHVTRLEAEANVHPHDVAKQLALYQALLDTKLKSSYDLVISRWERMCEFVRITTSFLHNSATKFSIGLIFAFTSLCSCFPDILDLFG